MPQPSLTPAQTFVLLDPRRASPIEAFKIALLSLVAQGALKIDVVQRKYFLRTSNVPVISRLRTPPDSFLARRVFDIVGQVAPSAIGVELRRVTPSAEKAFGPRLKQLKTMYLLPSLVSQGLLTPQTGAMSWLFGLNRFAHTPRGLVEKQRVDAMLDRARQLPSLLRSDPVQAKAIVLAAGPLLLLVPELKDHYRQLAALDQMGAFADVSGGDWSFDASCFDFDFGSFDIGFDASFGDGGSECGSDGDCGSGH